MGSRILARIIAKMMRWWAEKMELLGENQAGFRTGRSTADATQVIMRIQEDVADYKKRRRQQPEKAAEREEQRMEARLLDLEKAYPRINKPCLWGHVEKSWARRELPESTDGPSRDYPIQGEGKGRLQRAVVSAGRAEGVMSHLPYSLQHISPSCNGYSRKKERRDSRRGEKRGGNTVALCAGQQTPRETVGEVQL